MNQSNISATATATTPVPTTVSPAPAAGANIGTGTATNASSSISFPTSSLERSYSLPKLLATPKGNLMYQIGEAFVLHVCWEVPNQQRAEQLIQALKGCAITTHRDTPCVPTYFFRMSYNDHTLYGDAPRYVRDAPQICAAQKKLAMGVPRPAVEDSMKKAALDPSWLDLPLDAELPASQQQQPVAVECTELYLDERAFMEHAGSKDYLDAYGKVMNPALMRSTPRTIYMGTPNAYIVDKIVEPVLKAQSCVLHSNEHVWKPYSNSSTDEKWSSSTAMMFSIDFNDDKALTISSSFSCHCTTLITFLHPVRSNTIRMIAIMPQIPSKQILDEIYMMSPIRGEIHCNNKKWIMNETQAQVQEQTTSDNTIIETLRQALIESHLDMLYVHDNNSIASGYVLHDKIQEIRGAANMIWTL